MKKSKNEQGAALVILIVLLVVGAAAVYGGAKLLKKPIDLPGLQLPTSSGSQETSSPSGEAEPQISTKPDVEEASLQPVLIENFNRTGNLTDWDSHTERQTGNWILLYEAPGQPAIVANLAFNALSKCDLGNGEEVCDKSKLELGTIAKVQGHEENGVVTVIKLTKLALP
jgi:hypothetical protein